ncbi:hypothetical protein BKA61DRAFT_667630 [Leptodontidium sp. MPI-SDFR-AT-0119]|nr:hypothetical protein BKA61DRAFT_667630 [Leptodontidium sp. MPI-SDFR-AT-0119]
MPPDPWTHPTLRDFGFQNMDIPNGAGDPPSPSTDHSEALSDLYGDEPEVPWVDAIAELMPEAVVDHPETIWYTGLLGYCTCSKSVSEERWGEFQAKFQEIVLKRWTYEAGLVADPDGMLEHWKVHWITVPELNGKEPKDLRAQFQADIKEHEVQYFTIDSIFEKSQEKDEKISFILVVHATPDLKPDPGNLDQFEGHYKIPLDKVGDFWEISSLPTPVDLSSNFNTSNVTHKSNPSIIQQVIMDVLEQLPAEQTRTAAQQVLSTPELLENILSQLPFYDLLIHAQRVNRIFQGVISSYPSIQKALYFLPAPDQVVPQPCPFLRASSNTRYVDRRIPDWEQVHSDLSNQGKRRRRGEWLNNSGLTPYSRTAASSVRKEAVARQDASWRKMLLVQPPIKEAYVDSGKGWISSSDWLRMGDLHKNVVTCRHISVSKDGIGNFRVQHYS